MRRLIPVFLIAASFFTTVVISQPKTDKKKKPDSVSRLEISVDAGYSHPLLEAYGTNMTINAAEDQIFIDGKRLLVSDNLGAENGFTAQAYLKYSFLKKGYIKGLFNLGYNTLFSSHPGPSDYNIGVRVQSFSIGLGTEINPIGHEKAVYPGIFGLLRTNFMGGETFHKAGLDFFKVTPRYGYSAGLKLNYSIKKTFGMYLGYSYNYDNLWNRQTDEKTPEDAHVIVFRDMASETNGLTHDRRVAYWSLYLGMNFFFK
jgi:hypothetical protein